MVAIPWKFESSCAHHMFERVHGVVAQLVERCVRNAEVVSSNLISSTMNMAKQSPWGYGGMVDAEDLKSFDHCDRVGSSPTIPTNLSWMCSSVG